ncbi:hypothetical protein AVEN_212646-1 [Araneus ventricosus]|uniref:Uncharacterized protein n=1 Tax=Araneus ventricosus TaxID=182803 RepID=A0A4Y2M889_ARAVE|nr:hypothetical protein AVEN_212646-1 [Araneus ventricosus]
MERRFTVVLVLRLGREFYRGMYGNGGGMEPSIPDLGNHFGDLATNLATLAKKCGISKRLALARISVIPEPGGQYVGHATPASGTDSVIDKCILKYQEDNDVDIKELEAIVFKGTVTNTGWKNGAIRNIELKLKRPLQWFICLLHFNELPFKHLFEYFDGETTRPAAFSEKIGKQLTNSEKSPIINFEEIGLDENVNKTDHSQDQLYLPDIVRFIQTGQCCPDLAKRDPGLSVIPDG